MTDVWQLTWQASLLLWFGLIVVSMALAFAIGHLIPPPVCPKCGKARCVCD